MTTSNATKPTNPIGAKIPPVRIKEKPIAGPDSVRPTKRRSTPSARLTSQIDRARRYDQYRICFRLRWMSGDIRYDGGGGIATIFSGRRPGR